MTNRECLDCKTIKQLLECRGVLNAHGVGAKGRPLPARVDFLAKDVQMLRKLQIWYIKELDINAALVERQRSRIYELEGQVADAKQGQEELRGALSPAVLEDLVDQCQLLLELANSLWQFSKRNQNDQQEPLISPTCPFCKEEMELNEHDVGQDESATIVWECMCSAFIETHIYPPDRR